MDELESHSPEDAEFPVTFDPIEKELNTVRRRDMVNVGVRMAVARARGTWPANAADADVELWHYGTRAIAGDY
jgi:hypothetical protein